MNTLEWVSFTSAKWVRTKSALTRRVEATADSHAQTQKPAWRVERRQVPLYLTHDVWRQLRRLSLDTERSMNNLLIDGLNTVFTAHGLKTTDDLAE